MAVAEPVLFDHASFSALPAEFVDALNQTYFLHLLVTEPQKVIPPGKSLLSMMTHANFKASDDDKPKPDSHAQIADHVKEVAHKAFWNEALEALSSPQPSVQLPRLKRLYLDLYESLAPLFPPNHPILVSLSSPLPPTSSPLHSTINSLKEMSIALRQRCAPARDQTIDELLASLSHPPEQATPIHTATASTTSTVPASGRSTPTPTPLAEFVIQKIKAILNLAEDMKADLNTFVLGSMTEPQLQGMLLNDVKVRERELVLTIWGGKDVARARWRAWVAEVSPTTIPEEKKWIGRLFRALESDKPVYCLLPSSMPITTLAQANGVERPSPSEDTNKQPPKFNELPPQLSFSTPTFLYIQNYIQAIVIAAALRSLTRLAPPPANPKSSGSTTNPFGNVQSDFMTRIWTLLKAEIDDDAYPDGGGAADEAGETKLINLADEVVRARQLASSALNSEEEKRLRAAVERTLRSDDPVFLLLKKRLVSALEKRLATVSNDLSGHSAQSMIPTRMQTGKDLMQERAGKRPRLMLPESVLPGGSVVSLVSSVSMASVVPGFEESVLQQAISEVLQKIVDCIGWVEGVWGNFV